MPWQISLSSFQPVPQDEDHTSAASLLPPTTEKDEADDRTSEGSADNDLFGSHMMLQVPGRVRRIASMIPYVVAVVLIGLQIAGLFLLWTGKAHITYHTGTRLPPYMESSTSIQFIEYLEYAGRTPDHGMPAWKKQTANMELGRAYVKDPQTYGLAVPDWEPGDDGYTLYPISLYHQLHCLGTIREVFYTLNISEEIAYGVHLGHCFDYIRQSLWCAGDLTLEYTLSGWGVEHMCKDPGEIASFMESYNPYYSST